MFIHSEKLNPCKCGSAKTPNLDSDDMVPCWGVRCHDCNQFQHGENWTKEGAVNAWNNSNPIKLEKMSKEIKEKPKFKKFSKQETKVFKGLLQEKKAHEIAEEMDLDEKTISTYKLRLLRKTGAKTIIGLYVFNLEHKIVDL